MAAIGQLSVAHQLEAFRHVEHLVAVAHPDLQHAVAFVGDEVVDAVQQFGMAAGAHFGVAEFAHFAVFDLAAQLGRHGLHAVADAEHRDAQFEHGLRGARRVAFQRRVVAAGQDDAGGAVVADEFVVDVVGKTSENTPASRTRRAISWVTWEPKSRMRILECM
jgi:hypothetical protein